MAIVTKCSCDFCSAWVTNDTEGYPHTWFRVEVVVRVSTPIMAQTMSAWACPECSKRIRDNVSLAALRAFRGIKEKMADV